MQLFFHSLDLKQKSNFDKILVVVTDYRFEKFKKKFMEGTNVAWTDLVHFKIIS